MFDDKEIAVFGGVRKITLMFKHSLDMLAEIKKEHDNSVSKLRESLEDIEMLLEEKGFSVQLSHLANHADYLDENKMGIYRKRTLDYGNALRREMEQE